MSSTTASRAAERRRNFRRRRRGFFPLLCLRSDVVPPFWPAVTYTGHAHTQRTPCREVDKGSRMKIIAWSRPPAIDCVWSTALRCSSPACSIHVVASTAGARSRECPISLGAFNDRLREEPRLPYRTLFLLEEFMMWLLRDCLRTFCRGFALAEQMNALSGDKSPMSLDCSEFALHMLSCQQREHVGAPRDCKAGEPAAEQTTPQQTPIERECLDREADDGSATFFLERLEEAAPSAERLLSHSKFRTCPCIWDECPATALATNTRTKHRLILDYIIVTKNPEK